MTPLLVAVLAAIAVASWPAAGSRPRRAVPARPGRQPAQAELAVTPQPRGRGHADVTGAEVADTLVLLALALRAGLGLTQAVDQVRRSSDGAVRRDLGIVVAALRWGRPADEAWAFAGDRWEVAGVAWRMADDTGASPAELVQDAARRLRERHERDSERRAARAGVLLVLPLGLGFLPAFICTAVVPVVLVLGGSVLTTPP